MHVDIRFSMLLVQSKSVVFVTLNVCALLTSCSKPFVLPLWKQIRKNLVALSGVVAIMVLEVYERQVCCG